MVASFVSQTGISMSYLVGDPVAWTAAKDNHQMSMTLRFCQYIGNVSLCFQEYRVVKISPSAILLVIGSNVIRV